MIFFYKGNLMRKIILIFVNALLYFNYLQAVPIFENFQMIRKPQPLKMHFEIVENNTTTGIIESECCEITLKEAENRPYIAIAKGDINDAGDIQWDLFDANEKLLGTVVITHETWKSYRTTLYSFDGRPILEKIHHLLDGRKGDYFISGTDSLAAKRYLITNDFFSAIFRPFVNITYQVEVLDTNYLVESGINPLAFILLQFIE